VQAYFHGGLNAIDPETPVRGGLVEMVDLTDFSTYLLQVQEDAYLKVGWQPNGQCCC
jgi:hypothetical protein